MKIWAARNRSGVLEPMTPDDLDKVDVAQRFRARQYGRCNVDGHVGDARHEFRRLGFAQRQRSSDITQRVSRRVIEQGQGQILKPQRVLSPRPCQRAIGGHRCPQQPVRPRLLNANRVDGDMLTPTPILCTTPQPNASGEAPFN